MLGVKLEMVNTCVHFVYKNFTLYVFIIVILSPLLKFIHVQVIRIFYENVISLQSVVYLQE